MMSETNLVCVLVYYLLVSCLRWLVRYGIRAPIEKRRIESEYPTTETKHLHNIIMSVAEAAAPAGSIRLDTAPSSMGVAGAVSSDSPAPSSEKPSVDQVRAKV